MKFSALVTCTDKEKVKEEKIMQEVELYFQTKGDFYIKEAFKTLRSNIEFCGDNIRVITITSCMAHEGKSSIAMELAKSFAEAGNTTLLVDADMRKSVMIGRYKTGVVKYGLSQCLIGKNRFTEAVCETNVSNLHVIFSGPVPPNPSELLGSRKFAEILQEMRKSFSYIIIDTPPLGSVIDAAVVAKICDGTVLVIENNAISYRFVQKIVSQLDKAGSRILGVVLNKINMRGRGYYGKYYGKYYSKYYGTYGAAPEFTEKQDKKEQLRIELQREFYENKRREEQEKREQKKREKATRRRQKIKSAAIGTAKSILVEIVILLLICGVLLGGFEAAKTMGRERLLRKADSIRPELQVVTGEDELEKEDESRWQDGWVKYQDTVYQYNQEIRTFLIMGIDRNSDAKAVGEGTDGGQADALFLAVMNPKESCIKLIGINRNTMTDIDVYNEEGVYLRTVNAQIAVQHGFGDGMEKSCEYQKKAVARLFYNLPIHGYVAVNMSAIPTINDTVGGIDVTVLEDLTKADPSLVKDSKVHLSGESAFWYVKYRDTDLFGSADMRLARQQQYLTKLVDVARQEVKEDMSVALNLYKEISPQMVTDISLSEAAYLLSTLRDYQFKEEDFYLMQGETVMGEQFEEFYPYEDTLYEMILDIFYEKVE